MHFFDVRAMSPYFVLHALLSSTVIASDRRGDSPDPHRDVPQPVREGTALPRAGDQPQPDWALPAEAGDADTRATLRRSGLEFELPGTGEIIWAGAECRFDAVGSDFHLTGLRFTAMARKHERLIRDYVRDKEWMLERMWLRLRRAGAQQIAARKLARARRERRPSAQVGAGLPLQHLGRPSGSQWCGLEGRFFGLS